MTQLSLKRFSIVLLLAFTFASFGCGKKTPAPSPAPPPPPPPAPPAPTVSLSADRTMITAGQSVTLSYSSTNATSVAIDPGIGGVQPANSGTRQVSPASTTTYRATAAGPGGNAQSGPVTINVSPAAPPPAPSRPAEPPRTDSRTPTISEIFKDTMRDVLFDYDKYNVRQDQESNLLSMAAWLKQNPTVRFRIEGNADERGSQEYNIALGDERASSVMKFLSVQGVAENRMTTVSYGEERPVCNQQTEACWQQNRRAAFVLIP